jgi:hypothetical protein
LKIGQFHLGDIKCKEQKRREGRNGKEHGKSKSARFTQKGIKSWKKVCVRGK